MGNSTVTIQSVCDYAATFPDLKPVLATGGVSNQVALIIANDVANKMIWGYPWKWNQFRLPALYTNSFQQDYAVPGLVNMGWLSHGVFVDINNTALPKPIWTAEIVRDIELTSIQYGIPGQVCWLPNDQLTYGSWSPSTTFGQMLGVPSCPANPLMQVADSFGNFWVVTNNLNASVTTGTVNPFASNLNPVFPSPTQPNVAATTVTDGGVTWTAVNPKGQGLRVNPIPPQTGVVYKLVLIGMMRPPQFVTMRQTIEPIPDEDADTFRRGFIAYSYMHAKDPDVRALFQEQVGMWVASLDDEKKKHDLEKDNTGLVPSESIMTSPFVQFIGPANPYFPGGL